MPVARTTASKKTVTPAPRVLPDKKKLISYGVEGLGVVVNAVAFLGMIRDGLRFLGRYSNLSLGILAAFTLINLLIVGASAWILVRRKAGRGSWLKRQPAFTNPERGFAVATGVLSIAVFLLLVFSVLRYDILHTQAASPQALSIGVAEFGQGADLESYAQGRELSTFVARSLRREIEFQPGLRGEVSIQSLPRVTDEEAARQAGKLYGVSLVIWGWISETEDGLFVPVFTFIPSQAGGKSGLKEAPPWFDVEIRGSGSLELSDTLAQRATGLIEYVMGLILLEQGDYGSALREFQTASELTQANATGTPVREAAARPLARSLAIFKLAEGRTLAALSRPDEARLAYEQALELDPNYGPTYVGIGNIDYSSGRCDTALQWYDQAVRLAAELASPWYSRGNAYYCLASYPAAASDYTQAIRVAEEDDRYRPVYHLVLGITRCRMEQYDQGQAELLAARGLVPPGSTIDEAVTIEFDKCPPGAVAPPPPGVRATDQPPALATPFPTRPSIGVTDTPGPSSTRFPTAKPTQRPSPTPKPPL